MSTLLLLLPADHASAASEYQFVKSRDGREAQSTGQSVASLLPATSRVEQVTAVISHQQLSWHQITLPPGLNLGSSRQQTRVRAVLEGLLEEKLLTDPDQTHLALPAKAVSGETCWVAVCDKPWLQAHLKALEAAGYAVSRILPELAPSSTAGLWAVGEADRPWLVATGLNDNTQLASLPLQADASLVQSLLGRLPVDVPVLAEPQLARMAENLQRPVQLQTQTQRLLEAHAGNWDMAQFDLDLGSNTRMRRRLLDAWQSLAKSPQWRAARWAAAVAMVAQLIGLNAWAFKENQAIAQRQQQAKQVLQTTFPRVPVIVDAPVQMQRELDLLRSQTGALSSSDMEALLAASSQIKGIETATTLHYQDKQLRIQGLKLDAEALSDAQQSLAGSSYRLQREGAELILTAETQP